MKVVGNILLFLGLAIVFFVYWPVAKEEIIYWSEKIGGVRYALDKISEDFPESGLRQIVPVDEGFGIVIPKINANAPIFPNVDSYNPKEFLPILKKGVAHAKGTSFPGNGGNIYLFAHSTDAFFNFHHYNAIFYLIGKLEKEDEIDIFYKGILFKYFVFEKMVVAPEAIQYLKPENEEILTLQTCYPPGTTLERLIVRAKRAN